MLYKNWSRLAPSMLVASLLAACGGGGSGAPTAATTPAPSGQSTVIAPITQVDSTPTPITPSDPVPAPIPLEPASFRDLLATGLYDLQLQNLDSSNSSFSPFVAKHSLVSTTATVSGIQPTAVTRILSSTIRPTIIFPFDFTGLQTLAYGDWRGFGLNMAVEFGSPDDALVHFEPNGLKPSPWVWTMIREPVGDSAVFSTMTNIPLDEATNLEAKFIPDTTAYFSQLTNLEQVVVRFMSLPEEAVLERDLFNHFWCLPGSANQKQLVMHVRTDLTFQVLERPIDAACAGPEATDTPFQGTWTRVTLEGKDGIEFTFPTEVVLGDYQTILTPSEFAAKAKMVFLQTGPMSIIAGTSLTVVTTFYSVAFVVAPGAVIDSDTPRFSKRAVDSIRTAYGIN